MVENDIPVGQLFSQVYCDRVAPISDSEVFRRRLASFCKAKFPEYNHLLGRYLEYELGFKFEQTAYYDFTELFLKIDLPRMLNSITLIYRFFHPGKDIVKAGNWLVFVSRALNEENIGYYLDRSCGVHYLVDEEFSHNKVSALKCLETTKYAAVLAAFTDAHRHIDSNPPDSKAAIRSIFESLEILVRQMVETRNLNKYAVEKLLKPIVLEKYRGDITATQAVDKVIDGFAQWVDGMHFYRHGQGQDEPVAPPMDFTILVLSSGASYLRWLVEIDSLLN